MNVIMKPTKIQNHKCTHRTDDKGRATLTCWASDPSSPYTRSEQWSRQHTAPNCYAHMQSDLVLKAIYP